MSADTVVDIIWNDEGTDAAAPRIIALERKVAALTAERDALRKALEEIAIGGPYAGDKARAVLAQKEPGA